MKQLQLTMTTMTDRPLRTADRSLYAVNVCTGGVTCTMNTRYDGMQLPEDILTLAHYPKTVILIEYE